MNLKLSAEHEAARGLEPLLFTKHGNIPQSQLRGPVISWEFDKAADGTINYINVIEAWYLGDDEVKRSVHSYQARGAVAGSQQGGFGS
jgi:hypothetical protein